MSARDSIAGSAGLFAELLDDRALKKQYRQETVHWQT